MSTKIVNSKELLESILETAEALIARKIYVNSPNVVTDGVKALTVVELPPRN